MSATPINVKTYRIGGNQPALNLTAAQVIKASLGMLGRVIIGAPGSTSGGFTFNDANALVAAQTITGITAAAQAVVTMSTVSGSNPFAVGNTITFASVVGMTQINGVVGQVTAIGGASGAWTATTNINSSAFTAYSSGGTASSYGVGNQIWSLAFGAAANVAGTVFSLEFPFNNGLLLSAVPGGGSPIIACCFD